jgi:hypothetical protein
MCRFLFGVRDHHPQLLSRIDPCISRSLRRNAKESVGWIFYFYKDLQNLQLMTDAPVFHAQLTMAREFAMFAFVYSLCRLPLLQ